MYEHVFIKHGRDYVPGRPLSFAVAAKPARSNSFEHSLFWTALLGSYESEHPTKFGLLDLLPVVLDSDPPIWLYLRYNNPCYSAQHLGGLLCVPWIGNRRGRPRRMPELTA